MQAMKVLSVKQPWAWMICAGIKDIENRTWKLPEKMKGKRVLIHATRHIPFKQIADLVQQKGIPCYQEETYIESAIIGSVEIVDYVINHESIWAEKTELPEQLIDKCIWNWVLANPILFDKPILNVKGKLNFWEYNEGIEECYSCDKPFPIEEMQLDDDGNCYCPKCWKELEKEMTHNPEIQ